VHKNPAAHEHIYFVLFSCKYFVLARLLASSLWQETNFLIGQYQITQVKNEGIKIERVGS
jgi:hypothetical protein